MSGPSPTLIRGVLYPSQSAAARALGVSQSTINQALERGTQDHVGQGRRWRSGAPLRPCYINGHRWPSRTAAANALGVSRAAISHAIAAGRTTVRPGRACGGDDVR